MLDLDTGIDLDEIVPSFLVDEELGGTGVPVVHRGREFERIGKDGLADGLIEMRSRGDLDDLD